MASGRTLTGRAAAAVLLAALAAPALAADGLDAAIGAKLFKRQWVSAPSSTKANDGLGPLYTANSCASCHAGGAGSRMPVIRFGNGTGGDPVYGHQLQPFGVAGVPGEGTASLVPTPRGPRVELHDLAYGPLAPGTRISVRRIPDLDGVGAIAALGDDAILSNEGTAGGRARRLSGGRIGRFGWKAATATLDEQVASAFSLDLGLSTAQLPGTAGDCTPAERECLAAPSGSDHGEPEIAPYIVATLTAYVAGLAPPAPRENAAGAALFAALGCAACHRPALRDRAGHRAVIFSDLLLHDMGPDLDDGVAEAGASSAEWRTTPLAGLGRHLSSGGALLHDGRARTIAEAVAAHGGDGAGSRAAFAAASSADRAALETYLKGL